MPDRVVPSQAYLCHAAGAHAVTLSAYPSLQTALRSSGEEGDGAKGEVEGEGVLAAWEAIPSVVSGIVDTCVGSSR